MRTYVGSVDPVDGRLSVTITDNPEPFPDVDLRQHEHLLQEVVRSAEAPPLARPLPHLVAHSPAGFAWGYRGNGPADLALAILHRELAETVPAAVYLPFRDNVIARLPLDGFELSAADVWRWIRAHRSLVDQHVFGATAAPPSGAPPTSPPRPAGLSL